MSDKRWTDELCQKCGGNGTIKIPGGVSECPHCQGRCYEPESTPQSPQQDTPEAGRRREMDTADIVTLNGKQYRAYVDRVKRQIVFSGDVRIVPTDILVVQDMPGAIDAVEYQDVCTVVTLGARGREEK